MQSWEAMIETCIWCKGTKQFCPSSATFPVDWDEALLVSKVHNFVVPPNEQVQKVIQGNNLVGEQVVMSEKKTVLGKLCVFSRPGGFPHHSPRYCVCLLSGVVQDWIPSSCLAVWIGDLV